MAINKNGIVVLGAVFVDIKGYPDGAYIPDGRNAGSIKYIHGGVSRNVVEDIANIELRPTFLGIVDDTALGSDVQKSRIIIMIRILIRFISMHKKLKERRYFRFYEKQSLVMKI